MPLQVLQTPSARGRFIGRSRLEKRALVYVTGDSTYAMRIVIVTHFTYYSLDVLYRRNSSYVSRQLTR